MSCWAYVFGMTRFQGKVRRGRNPHTFRSRNHYPTPQLKNGVLYKSYDNTCLQPHAGPFNTTRSRLPSQTFAVLCPLFVFLSEGRSPGYSPFPPSSTKCRILTHL